MMQSLQSEESLLIDADFYRQLLEDIQQARNTIDLETYIFGQDKQGQLITASLCAAAKRGVKIRVLVDGIGTLHWPNEQTKEMLNHGISIRMYHPVPWSPSAWALSAYKDATFIKNIFFTLFRINQRNHRKICVIDDRIAYIGSANLIATYKINGKMVSAHDTTIRLTSIDCRDLKFVFDVAWHNLPPNKILHIYSSEHTFLLNHSRKRRKRIHKKIIQKIKYSNKRIWITNTYFVAHGSLLRAILHAAKRGVDVRILLPTRFEVPAYMYVVRTIYSTLIASHVRIYEYQHGLLHEKGLIIDNWFLLGSSNLNYRSFSHDLEAEVIIKNSTTKKLLEEHFLVNLNKSYQITENDLAVMPWYKKLLGRLFLFFKYWL